MISVLMGTRDRPDRLPGAIASVLAQTFQDWELVLVDNNRETTLDIPGDHRIKLVIAPALEGITAVYNLAHQHASGDLVCSLADDDRLLPFALETYAERIGDSDMIVAGTHIVDDAGSVLHYRGGTQENLDLTMGGYYMLGAAVCWRRSLAERAGTLFDPRFEHAADADLFPRMICLANGVTVIPDVLYLSVDHPGTMSRRNERAQLDDAAAAAQARGITA